uniref:hypothetical protein n=1 Tax=Nonomuraea bangladeshensis TaxID=404385 RepID=UPI003F497534
MAGKLVTNARERAAATSPARVRSSCSRVTRLARSPSTSATTSMTCSPCRPTKCGMRRSRPTVLQPVSGSPGAAVRDAHVVLRVQSDGVPGVVGAVLVLGLARR